MRITMIGTGYVGLVSGACIADLGHQVTCVDKDSTKITALNAGEIPLFEPGLGDIVRSNLEQGRLAFPPRWESLCVAPTLHSLRSAPRRVAGTGMPICPMFTGWRAKSPRRSRALPLSSPNQRCR